MDYTPCKCGHTKDMHRFLRKCKQRLREGENPQCFCPCTRYEEVTEIEVEYGF